MTDPDRQDPPFIREEDAEDILAGVGDEVVRNLMRVAIARIRMRAIRWKGMTAEEWRAQLPASPVDMGFVASVLADVFSRRDIIEGILAGKSIAELAGWDDDAPPSGAQGRQGATSPSTPALRWRKFSPIDRAAPIFELLDRDGVILLDLTLDENGQLELAFHAGAAGRMLRVATLEAALAAGKALLRDEMASERREQRERWIEAARVLSRDPSAEVLCPAELDGVLVVEDVHPESGDGFERYLRCPTCKAFNVMRMGRAQEPH